MSCLAISVNKCSRRNYRLAVFSMLDKGGCVPTSRHTCPLSFDFQNGSSPAAANIGRWSIKKKPAPGELQPFWGLMLGIYQLGVSPTLINPASPGWPKGGKAEACRAAQIADVQGSRRTVQEGVRPKPIKPPSPRRKAETKPARSRTLINCRTSTCLVSWGLAAYINRPPGSL